MNIFSSSAQVDEHISDVFINLLSGLQKDIKTTRDQTLIHMSHDFACPCCKLMAHCTRVAGTHCPALHSKPSNQSQNKNKLKRIVAH